MLTRSMPTKTTKRTRSTVPTPKPARKDGRVKSRLTLVAEAAAIAAKRELLLSTLNNCDWNLSAAARELGMPGASQVIRAIHDTGLMKQYDAARTKRA